MAGKQDVLYKVKCTASYSEDFTEDKIYPVYYSVGVEYIVNNRGKRVSQCEITNAVFKQCKS